MKRAPLLVALVLSLAGCPAPTSTGPTTPGPGSGGTDGSNATGDPGASFEAPSPPQVRLTSTIVPRRYDLKLWLDATKESFRGEVTIDVDIEESTRALWLNATAIEIQSAQWMPREGSFSEAPRLATSNDDFVGLDLGREVTGPIRLVLSYTGITTHKDFAGVFVQEEDGFKYLYTQMEALGARRAFPGFDQPEFKTPFKVTITAPSGQLAFANTPEAKRETAGDDVTYHFAESKPIPTYLVAFAVGPFEVVDIGTGGRNKTPLRIIVPKGRTEQVNFARANMAKVLTTLEDYFDLAYPYAKLDSIALPKFFGAMENPGLITYAAGILLVDDAKITQSFRERHLNIVAHEIAHQWFGDYVTLRWWNDIWLNESFASWMAAKTVDTLHPEWEGDISAVETRDSSMGADILESARRIRQEIKTKSDISGAFDGITYGKGAAVIAMFEQWIGEDKFRAAMREYMRTHAWKTTTSADFLASLAAASSDKLPPAFSTFLEQTGFPVMSAKLTCDKTKQVIELTQRRYIPTGSRAGDSNLWQVPVCVKYGAKGKTYSRCKLITEKHSTIAVDEAGTCPTWVHGNKGSVGYYRVSYQGDLLSRLLKANKKLSATERIGLIDDINALLGSGEIEVGAALSLLKPILADKSPRIIASAASVASGVAPLVPPKLHANYERFLGKLFGARARKLGWNGKPGDTRETEMLRKVLLPLVANEAYDRVLLKRASKLTAGWLKTRKGIDPEMLGAVLGAAAKSGDAELYGKLYAEAIATKDPSEKAALLAALGAFTQPKLTDKSLGLLKSGDFDLRPLFGILQVVMGDAKRRQRAYDFVKDNYDAITARMPPLAHGYLAFVAVPFCDEEHKTDAEAFFKDKAAGKSRSLAQVSEAIDLCIAQREKQTPGLTRFLRKQ